MVDLNANVTAVSPNLLEKLQQSTNQHKPGFAKAVKAVADQVAKVDELQKTADQSAIDLLTGKNQDVTSVVSAVAKADMSFKLLVGVRNKLIEAYKQTMNMNV